MTTWKGVVVLAICLATLAWMTTQMASCTIKENDIAAGRCNRCGRPWDLGR